MPEHEWLDFYFSTRTCLSSVVSSSFFFLLMVAGAAVAKEKVWEGMLKAVVVVRFSWRIVTMEEEELEELEGIGEDGLADPEEEEESSREEGEEREEVDEEEESLSDLEEDET